MYLFLILAPIALCETAQPFPNAAVAQFLPVIFTKVLPWFAAPVKVNNNANLPEDFLLTDALIKNRGYGYEYYKVTTEDGYILSLHRILSKVPDVTKPPVLIQHGVLASSDSWVIDANTSLAFTLSDNGYDVWLSDQRGSAYSKAHKYYSVKEYQYWNFTFHEAGLYDIPAFIDKIIEVTGKPQIYYIGHSMGTTVFLTMASLRPEYNDKVKAAVLLAPVATTPTLSELFQTVLRLLILYSDSIRDSFYRKGIYEMFPRRRETVQFMTKFCSIDSPTYFFCLQAWIIGFGENLENLDYEKAQYFLRYFPSGTSTRTFHHFSQIYRDGFRMYDYGRKMNLKIYGSEKPPFYPLKKVSAPVGIFYSLNDPFLTEKSAQKLGNVLPNVLFNQRISDPRFSHLDYVLDKNVKDKVYDKILEMFQSL